MKRSTAATMAVTFALAGTALGQAPAPRARRVAQAPPSPPSMTTPTPNAPAAPIVEPMQEDLRPPTVDANNVPEPVMTEDLAARTVPLLDEPLEPYLLTKDHGPFMVLAHVFRGPEATRMAQVLAKELRVSFHLPAYIWNIRVHPGNSNIRGVQPTAEEGVPIGTMTSPEIYRVYDEAAVLVGNCKSVDESQQLYRKVRKLHPVCLDGMPSIFPWRRGKGLCRALITTNPLVASEDLFPADQVTKHNGPAHAHTFDPYRFAARLQEKKPVDPLVTQMNSGPRSIYKCPAPYTVPVAEFRGRAALDMGMPNPRSEQIIKQSPLMTAHKDAEALAAALAKDDALVRAGYTPYVYHDRDTSIVTLGAFSSPTDPAIARLRGDGRTASPLVQASMRLLRQKKIQVPLIAAPDPLPTDPQALQNARTKVITSQ